MEDYGLTAEKLHSLSHVDRLNQRKIGELYGVGVDVVVRWMKESNTKPTLNRKLSYDTFFDAIDTQEKAYWLGFIWGDGYVWKKENALGYMKYSLAIDIVITDFKHLEKFEKVLGLENRVKKVRVSAGSKSNNEFKSRIKIGSSHLCETLISKYGVVPYRDNLDKIRENVPENMLRHFIRGFLDADGSVTHHRDSNGSLSRVVSFTVTKDMGNFILDYLESKELISIRNKMSEDTSGGLLNVYNLSFAGNKRANGILKHLYKDSSVHLDRKFEKYAEKVGEK